MSPKHTQLSAWLGFKQLPQLAELKRALGEFGINSRGWRLYLDYGDALFMAADTDWFDARHPSICGINAIAWLKVLQACEMDVPPPPELLQGMVEWGIPGADLANVPPLFLRAAWKACVGAEYGGLDRSNFIEQQIRPVARWFFSSGTWANADANLLKAGWASLTRRYEDWFKVEERYSQPEWGLSVHTMEWGGWRFSGLNTEQALLEEGRLMNHCVGNYGDICRAIPLRIYSVSSRKHGTRVATLSVECDDNGQWSIDQLKGPHNAEVDRRIWEAAAMLMQTIEQSYFTKPVNSVQKRKARPEACALSLLDTDDLPF